MRPSGSETGRDRALSVRRPVAGVGRTRRELLAAAGTAAVAGCPAAGGFDEPRPAVGEHVQGEFSVVDTAHRVRLDAADEFVATLANDGYDAAVAVTLYWVPRPDATPEGKTSRELLAAGYEEAGEQVVRVSGVGRRSVAFERTMPADVAGYYVRYHSLTYGARVRNRGASGPVVVTLVDTTDMSDQRPIARRTVGMEAGERRVVTFRTRERFESFRVDASGRA